MQKKEKIRVKVWDQMVLIGFALALFYSVFDSVLYIFLNYNVDFFQVMFGAHMSAIWSRLTILCLFAIFGSHAQYTINQRKAAEAALVESERKFRTIIETTPDGYYEVDLAGNFTFFNDSMCDILGYTRAEMTGMNHRESLDEANAKKVIDAFNTVYETGQAVRSLDWTLTRKDGSKCFVESSVTLIKDPKGQPIGFGGFLRDVTQRRRAEALYRAKLAAEAASRTKSEFLASMSHEIRTPLNSIIGLTELMLKSNLHPEQREDLDVVKSSGYALLSIINNILDFSKIEAGKFKMEATPFSLRDFLDASLKIMAVKSHEKGLELCYRIAPGVPDRLIGDPNRLRQVLLNLIDNAVKFTLTGEVVVYIAAQGVKDTEVTLNVSVVDTGIGIPAEKQKSIFGAYDQGDATISKRYGGTGLGLAVSAQLAHLMGGTIRVKSRAGHGSRFRFTARLLRQAAETDDVAEEIPAALQAVRVLVVDDNTTSGRILSEMLESWQMEVIVASEASAARDILLRFAAEGAPIGLVLADSDMPATDGFALAEWIKQQEAVDSPVVMMLTFPHLKRKSEFAELGVAVGIVKPVSSRELLEAVLVALGHKRPAPAKPPEVSQPAVQVPVRSLKILVAEDTAFNQKFILRLLERWGHQAELVETGRQAVDAWARQAFDIVLMDVQMPEMDGLKATAAIRKQERQTGAHIPIVAMTAHAIRGDRETCLAAGMDEYIAKPISADRLFEIIETLAAGVELEKEIPPGLESAAVIEDREELLDAFDGDWAFFGEVVDIFINDYPRQMKALQQALAQGDSAVLSRAAHTLKGMTRNFQANAAAEIALELEKKGEAGRLEDLDVQVDILSQRLAALERELKKMIEAHEGN